MPEWGEDGQGLLFQSLSENFRQISKYPDCRLVLSPTFIYTCTILAARRYSTLGAPSKCTIIDSRGSASLFSTLVANMKQGNPNSAVRLFEAYTFATVRSVTGTRQPVI